MDNITEYVSYGFTFLPIENLSTIPTLWFVRAQRIQTTADCETQKCWSH